MLELVLKDSKGTTISIDDWVRLTARHYHESFWFYVQIKIIDKGYLQPFHNFCFDFIEKADTLPDDLELNESGFGISRKDLLLMNPDSTFVFQKVCFENLIDDNHFQIVHHSKKNEAYENEYKSQLRLEI
jgi:hypothetical protein